ncbi:hypothetical protein AAEX28_09485 [Lentisphaerota bacterium WC36G]|nr:hypothetical protein LJT99_12325 [Lentisphaerae bacterium WC36]
MKILRLVIIAILLFILTGCGTTAKFVYPSSMKNLVQVDSNPVYHKKIAILPFYDYRSNENSTGTRLLQLIPLFPYGYINYNRPEAAVLFISVHKFGFSPSEDLAKAAALSLRHSNLFDEAFFTFGGQQNKADYVMYGNIYSTLYHGTIYSYGLSFAGELLWILGAPQGVSQNNLEINFQLKDKNKKVVWEHTYKGQNECMQWLYYRNGHDVKAYSILMEEAMNEVVKDLAKTFKNNQSLSK